ncbi:hypothetical protein RchiOBHm_Chr1g0374061 [Rosa chinensis]|uniref:Uncharacterized protein n=1 Tax=Rosa chinensis TaxID=74649 RepID=A0A2P6SM98_ROSCH|nr:hypothetical protein RchiOBHm_Chr1g0374061 [Rosa chinensis]
MQKRWREKERTLLDCAVASGRETERVRVLLLLDSAQVIKDKKGIASFSHLGIACFSGFVVICGCMFVLQVRLTLEEPEPETKGFGNSILKVLQFCSFLRLNCSQKAWKSGFFSHKVSSIHYTKPRSEKYDILLPDSKF